MIRRSTLVLVVIFAALVAGAIFWQRSQDKKGPAANATATPGSQLLFHFNGNISGLRLERTSGGMLEITRDDQGAWKLVDPKADETDVAAVEAAVSQLISTPVISTLEQGPSMEAAGLATPAYRMLITLDDGSQVVVNIGNATPIGTGYYVLVSQQGVVIASKFSLDPILKLLDNPPIMPTNTPAPETGTQNVPGVSVTPTP